MGTVTCNAIEFGLIVHRREVDGVFPGRVSKSPTDKIDNHEFLKRLWRQTDFSAEKREWLSASK